MSEIISFDNAGVSNETGIDITQGMIDNVANPFLDLNAIITQFKFNESGSVTIKIPAGTTVKYGNEQCTLLEDVTAILAPSNLTGDSHATTTSGTVLSGTSLEAGQLITSSCEWTVKLEGKVKVRTQDGYVILGSKDPNELDAGTAVSLSEGTNVYATSEINVSKVNEQTAQFYFLADVSYHQIVLQELYDTLTALQESAYKSNLLSYLEKNCINTGRNKLSKEEYDELKNMSLTEIKDYLSGLNWLSENDLKGMNTFDSLVGFLEKNKSSVDVSDIISIFEKYGVFSDKEIENLRNDKSLDGKLDNTWDVDSLLSLIYKKNEDGNKYVPESVFISDEIDNIRKSAAQKFFDSLKNESGITVENIKSALNGLCSVDGDDVNTVCDNLKNKVGSNDFTLDKFDTFLKNLLNVKVPSSEICPLPESPEGSSCVKLSDDAETLFEALENDSYTKTSEYIKKAFNSKYKSWEELKDLVLAGKMTIQEIYNSIKNNIPDFLKKGDGSLKDGVSWPPSGVTDPVDAKSLVVTEDVEKYFEELEIYTKGTNPLINLKDLNNICAELKVDNGNTIDQCLTNLKNAISSLKITPSKINDRLCEISVDRWTSLGSKIDVNDEIISFLIKNKSISLDELKEAVKNTNIYAESSITNLGDSIEGANSKTEIMELLSHNELKEIITIGDLVTGLTKVHKCSTYLYKTALIDEISATGKLDGNILYDYRTAYPDFDGDGNITQLASKKILDKLSEEVRIDYDGFKSGLLSISRFKDGAVDNAIANGVGNTAGSQEYIDNMNKLLNLCLLAGTPASGESSYALATGVQRTLDSNGNYVYEIVKGSKTIASSSLDSSFDKRDATVGMALPYFALAIMYEKTCIQQMILVEQLKQIEKINDEIRENNKALKALTDLYDKVYEAVTWSANANEVSEYTNLSYSVSLKGCEMSVNELDKYLKQAVKNVEGLGSQGTIGDFYNVNAESYRVNSDDNTFITVVGRYDRDGNNMWEKYVDFKKNKKSADKNFDSNTSNIDVKEQATLTHISNLQDQVRMYGDTLSTDAQLMTTKMEQYMQDANACVSACTQTVKSIGDYYKNIITNIR